MTSTTMDIPELSYSDCNNRQRISIARKIADHSFSGKLPETKNAEEARAQTIQIVRAATILEEHGDDKDYETVESLYETFPNLRDYDAKGSFVGNSSYENGWTP